MDITSIKSNFEKHDFEFSYFETVEEANAYLDSKIDGKTIGIGGSKTLDEMEILNILSKHNTVLFVCYLLFICNDIIGYLSDSVSSFSNVFWTVFVSLFSMFFDIAFI